MHARTLHTRGWTPPPPPFLCTWQIQSRQVISQIHPIPWFIWCETHISCLTQAIWAQKDLHPYTHINTFFGPHKKMAKSLKNTKMSILRQPLGIKTCNQRHSDRLAKAHKIKKLGMTPGDYKTLHTPPYPPLSHTSHTSQWEKIQTSPITTKLHMNTGLSLCLCSISIIMH